MRREEEKEIENTQQKVEEIVEEFDKAFPSGVYSIDAHQDQGGDYSLTKEVKNWLRQALTTAHQQGVEEERESWKLYIWHDIRNDYTGGIGFAVARNIEEARNAIKDVCLKDKERKWEWESYKGELMNDPEIRELPSGDWISGGG